MNPIEIRKKILDLMPEFSGVATYEREGTLLYEEAFGEKIPGEDLPIKPGTAFPTASGCKIFTAVAILKLVEKGEISLGSSVNGILPDTFPHMAHEVTAFHLLTHTSGFRDYFDEAENDDFSGIWSSLPMYSIKTPWDFLPLLRDKTMEFTPGERFKYNNGGYVILSMIIEKISGMSFPEFVSENIFLPAGMFSSGYFPLDSLPVNAVLGYTDDGHGGLKSNIYAVPIMGGGDGGAYTTASDMSLFWKALLKGGLLSEETVKLMCTPHVQVSSESLHYGLGVWMETDKEKPLKLFVTGGDPGVSFRSIYRLKDESICTVLCNRDNGSYDATLILEENFL